MDHHPDPFELFYRKHRRWVYHRAALIVGERNADDVTQEVFFSASRACARGSFDLSTPAWGWLRTATHRAARDMRAALQEQPAPQDKDTTLMDETLRGDPERALVLRRQWDEILDLLDALSPERRLVWVMSEIDQMSVPEIAAELELPVGTVYTRIRLAREELETALARKRANEKRKLEGAALLILPLDADGIGRRARALPVPELPDGAAERMWRRIQARREADQDIPGTANVPEPPPRTTGQRRRRPNSQASHATTLALGILIGLLVATALADARGGPRVPEYRPGAAVAAVAPPSEALVPPAVAGGETMATSESASNSPPPSASPATSLAERMLVASAHQALEPPDPDPVEALRLLELYAQRYPHSRNFAGEVDRLRREAQRLAERGRQGRLE